MPVQNATITANDYVTQSRINIIMFTDYGQTLLSGQVSVGDIVTDDQLDNLRTDIKKHTHPQGSGPTIITREGVGNTCNAEPSSSDDNC